MLQPVDSSILHEIVRLVEARRKVPERLTVRGREYQITYLEDHQRRLEEALMRYDADRLNMLYGQLASKVKYQMLRRVPARAPAPVKKTPPKAAATPAPAKAKLATTAPTAAKSKKAAKAASPKKVSPKKVKARTPAPKKGKPKRTAAKAPPKAVKKTSGVKRAKVVRKKVAAKRRSARAARS